MRLAAQPRYDTAPLEAYATAATRWLASILLWFSDVADWVEPLARRSPLSARWLRFAKRRVTRGLRHTVSSLRRYLAGAAFVRLGRLPPARRAVRGELPRSRRRFYRAATGRFLRGLHHGSLRQRTAALTRLFDALEALTTRIATHMRELFRTGPIVRLPLPRPLNDRAPRALMPALACADTS